MPEPIQSKGENIGWANLKPAQKGEVRNPHGRPPKAVCIPDILRRIGSRELATCPDSKLPKALISMLPEGTTRLEGIMCVVYQEAEKGEHWAVEFIAERTEGKVKIPVRIDTQRIVIRRNNQETPQDPTPDTGGADDVPTGEQ